MAETIFILGAGASMPYGFPSGEKLKNQIQEELGNLIREIPLQHPTPGALSAILKMGSVFDARLCVEFSEALARSGVYSIDAFLERRPEFRKLGKSIIAYLLLKNEKDCLDNNMLFRSTENEENWYRYFFNEIKDLKRFNFKIYTFNYERSLEYYLIEAYRNLFNYSSEEIFEKINAMNIIHLHGSLGPIDSVEKVNSPNFGNVSMISNYTPLKNLGQGIDIIYEVDSAKMYGLRNDIKTANNIVFIGFGFDKTNMKNIDFYNNPFDYYRQRIWATTYRLSNNEIRNMLFSKVRFKGGNEKGIQNVDPEDASIVSNETALYFLRNTLPHYFYNI